MPRKNTVRFDIENSFYHIYGRGVSRGKIFIDDNDRRYFLSLLEKYLSEKSDVQVSFRDKVKLVSFCLMGNHFHLLMWQTEEHSIMNLMRRILNSYSHYFNTKYDRSGSLLESRYKSVRVASDEQLLHLSRYIHHNPDKYMSYKWSSLPYYLGNLEADWINPDLVLDIDIFRGNDYREFMDEYKDMRDLLENLKHDRADR